MVKIDSDSNQYDFYSILSGNNKIPIKLLVIYDLNYTNGTKSLINIVNFEYKKKN